MILQFHRESEFMLIKCIGNTPGYLSCERARQAYERDIHQEEVGLEIGRQYTVYGVVFRNGEDLPWFLVCEEDNDDYPTPHLGAFFNIVDGEIPVEWEFTTTTTNVGNIGILPKRWARDPYFMEKLVNGEADALNYFRQLKAST